MTFINFNYEELKRCPEVYVFMCRDIVCMGYSDTVGR